jgi:hypothetical protein
VAEFRDQHHIRTEQHYNPGQPAGMVPAEQSIDRSSTGQNRTEEEEEARAPLQKPDSITFPREEELLEGERCAFLLLKEEEANTHTHQETQIKWTG